MALRYDVSARLAEGREAVAHTQTYVAACHRRGYRDPELTGYDAQLADRYDSEAGLDLRSLDDDCAALNALADAADDALRAQRQQLVELDNAWRGSGADAAMEFLRQHCDAAAQLTDRLRAAAAGCGALRDELWRLIDTKVAAVVAVDERVGAHRPSWLAAAHAVSSGANDERAAEVVETQVMPYVDNDVRGEWVAAVRSAQDGCAAAYSAAVAAAEPGAGVVFAIPGDLGPVLEPDVAVPAVPVPVAPIAGPVDGPPVQTAAVAPDPPAQPASDPAPAGPLAGQPGDLGPPGALGLPSDWGLPSAGLPGGAGGGLGGLAGLGGLIPRLADALGEPGVGEPFDEPFDDHPRVDADPTDSDDPADSEPDAEPAAETAEEPDAEDPAGDVPVGDAAPEPAPAAGDFEPVVDTGDSEDEQSTGVIPPKTPCETAAEELPQVGE
ncbi:hypothetical protein [Mycobacterium sp. SMC-14]|uniref:hypothetical protein n=1 Tax=Mycobacterium sp. SMC-14 TaxID=3385968 RepID=UPI00390CBEE1